MIKENKIQTFLPHPNFEESAKVLDYRRLGKQRIETKQILNALLGKSKGWINHPITKAWKGYERALIRYGIAICKEWRNRGYKDKQLDWFLIKWDEFAEDINKDPSMPKWFGNYKFHSSHRAALLYKFPEYYQQFGWTEKPELNYFWP